MPYHITPFMMERVYDYLLLTPPFRTWKLPLSDDIEFRVIKHNQMYGDCGKNKDGMFIRISNVHVTCTDNFIRTMAHEMIHIEEWRRNINEDHGHFFTKAAKRTCKWHGWEIEGF